jgi:hypothetical protein
MSRLPHPPVVADRIPRNSSCLSFLHEILLFATTFLAGLLNATVGGGGLLQVPMLMLLLPETPIATLLASTRSRSRSPSTSASAESLLRRVGTGTWLDAFVKKPAPSFNSKVTVAEPFPGHGLSAASASRFQRMKSECSQAAGLLSVSCSQARRARA